MSVPVKDQKENKMDPGWNDPPMLNYSPSNPPPKSRITNKRVAFPINSSPSTVPPPTNPLPDTNTTRECLPGDKH